MIAWAYEAAGTAALALVAYAALRLYAGGPMAMNPGLALFGLAVSREVRAGSVRSVVITRREHDRRCAGLRPDPNARSIKL